MIGKLTGLIDLLDKDHLILDVNGVGYIVFCSGRTLNKMPSKGEKTSLLIETHVREDQITLYGFDNIADRNWFRELITVKGVGPKLALSILSMLSPEQLGHSLAARDKSAFTKVSGVGPKLVERIFAELKDKTINIGIINEYKESASSKKAEYSVQDDAISALVNLGYSRNEAYHTTCKIIANNDNIAISDLVKLALKELAR